MTSQEIPTCSPMRFMSSIMTHYRNDEIASVQQGAEMPPRVHVRAARARRHAVVLPFVGIGLYCSP